VTVTVAWPLAVLPAPLQVTVYVAVASEDTRFEPLTSLEGDQRGGLVALHDVALLLVQDTTLP